MPAPVDPLSVDFATLRTFAAVRRLGSFTAAAAELGLTQSSVSYAVDRLRRAVGDPLFVRQGGGVAATERCVALAEEAEALLAGWAAVSAPEVFAPAVAEGELTLSLNYYERAVILPALARAARAAAPGLRLSVIASGAEGGEQLRAGRSDLLISPLRLEGTDIHARRLTTDRYVLCTAPGRPAPAGGLEGALAAPHVLIDYGGGWRSGWLAALDRIGRRPRVALSLPSPGDLPRLLAGSDLVCVLPERLALTFGDGLARHEGPVPAPFDIDMFWTARTHRSARHRWLRGLAAEAARGA